MASRSSANQRLLTLFGVAALLASACSLYRAPPTPGPEHYPPAAWSSDAVGDGREPGVEIVAIDRSGLPVDGTVRYRLRSKRDEPCRRRWVRVAVFFARDRASDRIELDFDPVILPANDLQIAEPRGELEIVARGPHIAERIAGGGRVLGTRLYVIDDYTGPTLVRSAAGPGTRLTRWPYLEVVGLATQSDLRRDPPRLWVDVENVWRHEVSALDVRAVFHDAITLSRTHETPWQRLPALAPGETTRIDLDVSGVPSVADSPFTIYGRAP